MDNVHKKSGRLTVQAVVDLIRTTMGQEWVPVLYRDHVLPLRTRRYEMKPLQATDVVEINYTLLGVELKVARRRLMMPDWATARYLRAFALIGLEAVAVPYDITQVSQLADDLECAWQRMLMLVEHYCKSRSHRFASLVRSRLTRLAREELMGLGAGGAYPQFSTSTKVYRRRSPGRS